MWRDEDGVRQPGGDTHAWSPGRNEALCGVSLHRAGLDRFPHVSWADARWLADTTDRPLVLCARCVAATRGRDERPWSRVRPRP
ncbi:hypothetical protein SAMN05216174_107201 [Actinokineospora iranica]|uniref:Uncharacterized protein n=2 Tax=Actinokineospora iranica TaxID=1271860 RepID=A0A1G6S5D9_9PSEU|nr:hypothetical protein SAMN05216174_107201 [Actinokineospora iranica]